MPTLKHAAAAATALQLMYYALCVMMIAVIALFLAGYIVPAIGMNLFDYLKLVSYVLIGAQILYVVGGFLCLAISRESEAGPFLLASLGLWAISLILVGMEIIQVVPVWVPFARYALNLASFVLFLMFLRVLAETLDNRKLVARARNAMQICIGVMVLWAVYILILFADPLLFLRINTFLGLGMLVATLIAFVVYANLLTYTASALRVAARPEPLEE